MADDRLDPGTADPCSRRCRRDCSLHSSSTPSIGDISVLAHISEIRAQLEPLAARRAAERATRSAQPDLEELAAHIEQLDVTQVDRTESMRWDLAVHWAIYRAAGNPHMFLDRVPTVDEHVGEHVALLRAIAAGDTNQADELAREHVLGFEKTIRAVI